MDIDYFKIIQKSNGALSKRDATIRQVKHRLKYDLKGSVNYETEVLKNGEPFPCVITSTRDTGISNILSIPDEHFKVGDEIIYQNLHWMVISKSTTDKIQDVGKMQVCNQEFKFQDHLGVVRSFWGITNPTTTPWFEAFPPIEIVDGKLTILIPYNEFTKKIYVNQRFILDETYTESGEKIPMVYEVLGFDLSTNKYGHHTIIVAHLERVVSQTKDDIDNMVADYTPEADNTNTNDKPECEIKGIGRVRAGGNSRILKADFHNENGNPVVASWDYEIPQGLEDYVHITENDNQISISVDMADEIIGSLIVVKLSDEDGNYSQFSKAVEVI